MEPAYSIEIKPASDRDRKYYPFELYVTRSKHASSTTVISLTFDDVVKLRDAAQDVIKGWLDWKDE